jgi:hypothetical protein
VVRSLRRALDDLGEGIRSLFGAGPARPALVEELLGGRSPDAPPHRARPARRGPRRPRAAASRHLVLVK